LCERVASRELTRKVVESFIKSGTFSAYGYKKSAMLLSCDAWLEAGQRREKARSTGQTFLFDAVPGQESAEAGGLALPDVPELPARESLSMEREVLGLYLSGHPAMGVANLLGELTTARISELPDLPDQTEIVIGGLAAQLKSVLTKKQQRMANLRLEDLGGGIEVVVFPRIYNECQDWLKEDSLVLISGRLDVREDGAKVLANWIVPLVPETLTIDLPADPAIQAKVKALIAQHAGTVPVFLRVTNKSGSVTTMVASRRHWVTPSEKLNEELAKLVQGRLG
jgi:DNA polymerase-3 subunit alpha